MSTENSNDTDEPRHPYETDDSFHPMGEQWEDRMREELEDTDYDADLGMQMARDAQRLVAGEISEEEFYAEYHDDVKEEFEADERPIFDDLEGVDLDEFDEYDDDSLLESLADVDLNADDLSRREMMNKMGAAGLFLGYSAFATYDDQGDEVPQLVDGVRPRDEDERKHRWGMTIDLERCDGCLACVTGCINENGTSSGANWMYVFTYEDTQSESENPNQLVRPCQHCSNAPCAKVCPVRARHTRSKDGLVLTNYETCIGCRYCQVACPYGVNYFQWGDPDVEMSQLNHIDMTPDEVRELDPGDGVTYSNTTYAEEGSERLNELQDASDHVYDGRGWWTDSRPPIGTMGKCTMCPSRQDKTTGQEQKGSVACQDACDAQGMSAIHFGDLDAEVGEEYDRAVRYLEERQQKADNQDRTNKFDANIYFYDTDVEGDTAKAGSMPDLSSVDNGSYSLHLVQRSGAAEDWGVYDTKKVLVTDSASEGDSVNANVSEAPYDSVVGQTGELSGVPEILARDGEAEIEATVSYPAQIPDDDTGQRQIGLVLYNDATEEEVASVTYTFQDMYTSNTAWDSGLSTFKLLEDLGTAPNITYIGNEPGPKAEQVEAEEMPVSYAQLNEQGNKWGVTIIDERLERLEYGANAPDGWASEGGDGGGH